jgi:1,4-dihydroxy-6-naphthoate synthase
MVELTLAHSPDPDDVFMWWPITGMIEPPTHAQGQAVVPARVVSVPEIDTGRFHFVPIAADIAALNRRAMASGDLDITALSMNCYSHVCERYQLTCFGSSMGYGYGPRVVGRAGHGPIRMASPVCYAAELDASPDASRHLSLTREARDTLLCPDVLVAIPGRQTTAFLLLSMMLGPEHAGLRCVEMPFDRILDAVRTGEGGVTHGLLIHQSQLTFGQAGLELIADVGEWWLSKTGLPLPLGGNAVRRDLDERLGAGATREIVRLLDRSIRYALERRERSLEYSMRFAPEIDRAQAERYIEMYVNDLTVDAGEVGERAVERMLGEGHRLGLCPDAGRVEMLRPS